MSSSSTFNNPNVGGPLDALDWSSVDPEDVTSLLMAADLGLFSGDETVMKQRLEELTERSRVEQRARDAVAVSRPLVVLPDDESQSSSDEEVPNASPDEAPSPTSPPHDGEDDEAEGDDGGMGSRRGTAEASWDETDWKLVRIIRRRRCAPLPGSVAQAADAAEHEHAAVELLWEYQCVWDGCTEPTWERGAFLMEMGFGAQLKSFVDSKRPPVFKPTKRLLPDKPPSHEEYHRKRQELRQHRRQRMHHGVWSRFCGRVAAQLAQHAPKGLNGVIDGLVATSSSIRASVPDPTIGLPTEHECPDQLHSLLWYLFGHAFVSYQLHVTEFETVFPASLERVVQRAATEEGSIELVYHGTRQSAVAAITREGLRLPQDHKGGVLNGSAYGLGIYVGPCLDYPVMDRYSPEGDVFVCLSFCPKADPQAYHKVSSQITVIKKDGLVAPLFHVSFDRKQSGNTNIQRVMVDEKERVVFRANF